MEHQEWFILLLSGICLLPGFSQTMEYHFVNVKMNWTDARAYCQSMYTDLAIFPTHADLLGLNTAVMGTARAWIGLMDDPKSWKGVMAQNPNSWKWSYSGTYNTYYQNWGPNEPNNVEGVDTCVALHADGTWINLDCSKSIPFVCFYSSKGGGPPQTHYVFYQTAMNWTDARTFCRANYADLAMIFSAAYNSVAASSLTMYYGWIGLYRVPWTWVDNTPLTYTSWLSAPPQPDNALTNEFCGAMNPALMWDDDSCEHQLTFFCHGALKVRPKKLKASTKYIMQANVDLSNPTIKAQILQELDAKLEEQGLLNIILNWKTSPEKEEEAETNPNELLYHYELCDKECT